jgi:hypothetical protein
MDADAALTTQRRPSCPDLLLSPAERSGSRHLELVRDSRGLTSTWDISEG